jgi:hypothetical protein
LAALAVFQVPSIRMPQACRWLTLRIRMRAEEPPPARRTGDAHRIRQCGVVSESKPPASAFRRPFGVQIASTQVSCFQ